MRNDAYCHMSWLFKLCGEICAVLLKLMLHIAHIQFTHIVNGVAFFPQAALQELDAETMQAVSTMLEIVPRGVNKVSGPSRVGNVVEGACPLFTTFTGAMQRMSYL